MATIYVSVRKVFIDYKGYCFIYQDYQPGNSSSTGIVVMFSMLEIVVEFSRIGWVVVS